MCYRPYSGFVSKVVNLNKFRKRKQKAEADKRAEHNRRFYGRTKAERAAEALRKKQLESKVDGARLEREDDVTEPPEG